MSKPDPDTEHLLETSEAARAAGVTPSAIYRAAAAGRLRVAARTHRGTRLFTPSDIAAYRHARLVRLARDLRVAAEPRRNEPWDALQSNALDLAVAVEEAVNESGRR